jgi:hypothetical protein
LEQFNNSFGSLFERRDPEDTDEPTQPDEFTDYYGWIFNTSAIAEYERITLDQAYDLPVMQALNDLSYLKAKQAKDARDSKQ